MSATRSSVVMRSCSSISVAFESSALDMKNERSKPHARMMDRSVSRLGFTSSRSHRAIADWDLSSRSASSTCVKPARFRASLIKSPLITVHILVHICYIRRRTGGWERRGVMARVTLSVCGQARRAFISTGWRLVPHGAPPTIIVVSRKRNIRVPIREYPIVEIRRSPASHAENAGSILVAHSQRF
jgi:hypothetical protein